MSLQETKAIVIAPFQAQDDAELTSIAMAAGGSAEWTARCALAGSQKPS